MNDEWDAEAGGWDADPFARAYSRAAMASLTTTLDERGRTLTGATVCDFGCGTGLLTEQLADAVASIDAVDTSPAMREVLDAKTAAHGWTNVRTLSELPRSPDSYDLIACSSVCTFLDDYPSAVHRMAQLLRPDGVFVQWDWEREGASDEDEDAHGLTRSEIRAALDAAGLVDVRVGTAFEVDVEGHSMRPLIGVGQRASGEHVSADVVPEPSRQSE